VVRTAHRAMVEAAAALLATEVVEVMPRAAAGVVDAPTVEAVEAVGM
jgi:hypothetical protein